MYVSSGHEKLAPPSMLMLKEAMTRKILKGW